MRSRAFRLKGWRPSALELFKLRDFRYFWLGNAISDLAYDMRIVAIGWLVLDLTNSPFWVGFVAGIPGVAILIFSLAGGAVADRFDRRQILLVVRMIPAVLTFFIAYIVTSGLIEPWHLIVFTLAGGTIFAFAAPARRAFVADIVEGRNLLTANSLTATAGNVGEICGPAIAGYLIASRGVDTTLYAICVFFFISVVFTAFVRARPRTSHPTTTSLVQDISEGLAYARRTQPIMGLLLMVTTTLFATAIFPLMPVYARDVLNVGASGYGVMTASLGAGFLAGSILAVISGNIQRKGLALVVFGAMWDLSMLAFGFSRVFPLSVALIFVMGVGGALFFTLTITLLQTYSSDAMRGRVMSLHSLANSTLPLGMMLGGVVAQAVSNELALALGALIATPMAIVVYLRSPVLRRA